MKPMGPICPFEFADDVATRLSVDVNMKQSESGCIEAEKHCTVQADSELVLI